jgi:hypothetical protein
MRVVLSEGMENDVFGREGMEELGTNRSMTWHQGLKCEAASRTGCVRTGPEATGGDLMCGVVFQRMSWPACSEQQTTV